MKKEEDICSGFAVAPQTAKVTATVHDNCLVKMEKALNLYHKILRDRERNYIHITLITIYCYNCSILLCYC